MNNKVKLILGIFYLIGISLSIYSLYAEPRNLGLLGIACIILLYPWISCLKSAWNNSQNKGVWIYLLIFFGALGIPLYLIFGNKRD